MFSSSSSKPSSSGPSFRPLSVIAALAASLALAGCVVVRMGNSLGEQRLSDVSLGGPYFVISAEGFKNFDPVSFNRLLHNRYPSLFAQTPEAVPIMIRVVQGATKSSDVFPVVFLGMLPQVMTCGLIGTVWESDQSKLDVGILVSEGEESTTTVEVSSSRQSHGLLDAAVARLVQWPSHGWHSPRGDLAAEEFEGLVNALADALAASFLKMPPESRAALRKNPVAHQRFQKKFPWGFGVQKRGVAERTIHRYPAADGAGHIPKVLGLSFDAERRVGEIRADISECDYAAAQRRLINVEIPRLCREKTGWDVSLLSIQGESLGPDKILKISFIVVE